MDKLQGMAANRDIEELWRETITKGIFWLAILAATLNVIDIVMTYIYLKMYPDLLEEVGILASCIYKTYGTTALFAGILTIKLGTLLLIMYSIFPKFIKYLTVIGWSVISGYAVIRHVIILIEISGS